MPYTSEEADPDLELYFRGPEKDLKRFHSGATTSASFPTDPAQWIKGRQFIYKGKFGLEIAETYAYSVAFSQAFYLMQQYRNFPRFQFQFSPAIVTTDLTVLVWYFKDSNTVTGTREDLIAMFGGSPFGVLNVWTEGNDTNIVTGHKRANNDPWTIVGNSGVGTKVPLDRWTQIGIVIAGSMSINCQVNSFAKHNYIYKALKGNLWN